MYNEVDMKISKIVVLLFYAENTEKAISRSFNINSMRPGYAFIIFIVQLSSSKWGRNSQNHFVLNVIKLLHFKTLSTIAFLKKQFEYTQRKTRMNAQLVWAYIITSNVVPLNDPSVSQSVFTITEKAPIRAFSWLKAPTSIALSHLRHYKDTMLNRR